MNRQYPCLPARRPAGGKRGILKKIKDPLDQSLKQRFYSAKGGLHLLFGRVGRTKCLR